MRTRAGIGAAPRVARRCQRAPLTTQCGGHSQSADPLARQLALHALTLHGPRYPEGRIEDWATFAIASALAGRERDARNAFLVTLSLAPNLERQCKAALDVYAIYGERLRAPIEAMLQSANASGRANGSAFCEWPPHWVVSGAR